MARLAVIRAFVKALPRWTVVLAGSIVPMAGLAGCGGSQRSDSQAVVAKQRAAEVVASEISIPTGNHPQLVVSGNGSGLVLTIPSPPDTSRWAVWLLTGDGSARRSSDLPALGSASGTYFDGTPVIAGEYCRTNEDRDTCKLVTGAIFRFDDKGNLASTVEPYKKDVTKDTSEGISIIGTTPDTLWVAAEGGILGIDNRGTITRKLPSSYGEPCLLDGELYSLGVGPNDRRGGGPGTPGVISGIAGETKTVDFVVSRLKDDKWERISAADRSLTSDVPGGPLGSCLSTGLAIGTVPRVESQWTPSSGWQAVKSSVPETFIEYGEITTSSHTRYVVLPTGFLARSEFGAIVGSPLPLPRASDGVTTPPTAFWIDDSGPTLVACRDQGEGATCALGTKSNGG